MAAPRQVRTLAFSASPEGAANVRPAAPMWRAAGDAVRAAEAAQVRPLAWFIPREDTGANDRPDAGGAPGQAVDAAGTAERRAADAPPCNCASGGAVPCFAHPKGSGKPGATADAARPDPAKAAEAELQRVRAELERERDQHARATAALTTERHKLAEALADLATTQARVQEAAEADVAELALAVAEELCVDAWRREPERVRAVVRTALVSATEGSAPRGEIVVRVAPAVRDLVDRDVAETLEAVAGPHAKAALVRVLGDAAVGPGGVIVETTALRVDATLETRLRAVRAALGLGQAAARDGGDTAHGPTRAGGAA